MKNKVLTVEVGNTFVYIDSHRVEIQDLKLYKGFDFKFIPYCHLVPNCRVDEVKRWFMDAGLIE